MSDSWFSENFNGISEEFFDDVLEFVDLPLEDVEKNAEGVDWNAKFEHLEPPSSVLLFTGSCHKQKFSRNAETSSLLFQTSSPISVLEQRGRSSVKNSRFPADKYSVPLKRARSKRPRPSTITTWNTIPFISSKYHLLSTTSLSEDSETSVSEQIQDFDERKRKKRRDLSQLSNSGDIKTSEEPGGVTRKCMHCEITKTPLWREGPMGPKTLCNACGVRYRTGRLFPEYRPAASPTFVPTLHSNSHRKVLEMRSKTS